VADFAGADFAGADFAGADFAGADFAGAAAAQNGTVGADGYDLLIALAVALLLVLLLRWVFRPSRPRPARRPPDAAESAELGLLTVVVTGLDRQSAMLRRARLGQAGIRSSMSRRRDGRFDVLVFAADAGAARTLLEP
jgi:uncharacterized protein YjbI with pentapeptide repeats